MNMCSDPAVILVGGRGTRLGEAAEGRAKPLVDVGGRPFLDYLMLHLARYGFRRCVLLCGFQAKQFRKQYGNADVFGLSVECIVEDSPAGTGGAVINALDLLDDHFLLLNGDSFFNIDPMVLRRQSASDDWAIRMALRDVPDTSRYGRVIEKNGRITNFAEKAAIGPGSINAGIYWVKRSALAQFPQGVYSLELDILPRLISDGHVWGWAFDADFIDIGVPEDLARARRDADEFFGQIPGARPDTVDTASVTIVKC